MHIVSNIIRYALFTYTEKKDRTCIMMMMMMMNDDDNIIVNK